MEFTYRSKMETGEGIILNLWQKALGIFGVLLAALTTEVMLLQHSTKFMYVMSLPLVILIIVMGTAKYGKIYRKCRCTVKFWDQHLEYYIPAIKFSKRDYTEYMRIEYYLIDCVEFDPPTLQLWITSKDYDIKWERASDGEDLLNDDWGVDDPIYFKFMNKKDAKHMLELVRRYITEDYYVNGIDLG